MTPEQFDPSVLVHDFGPRRKWQMSAAEAFTLQGILSKLQPELSLEIGTLEGGSLQAIARWSKSVISLDLEPAVAEKLKADFTNVDFRSGDSKMVLREIVSEINSGSRALGFVLVDADHTAQGVRADLENLLRLTPRTMLVILMHDSFNPGCRQGLRQVNWAGCPYLHFVELDYVPGFYFHEAHDSAPARSMYSGFACAVMLPEKRVAPLAVRESQAALQRILFPLSSHAPEGVVGWTRRKVKRLLRRRPPPGRP